MTNLSCRAWAQSSDTNQQESLQDNKGEKNFIDKTHEAITKSVFATSRWLDWFFSNERSEDEENKSRFRIQTSVLHEKADDTQADVRLRLRLVLPKTEEKLHLVFSGEADEEQDIDDALKFKDDNSSKDSDEEGASASLWYFLKNTVADNISIRIGLKIRGGRAVFYAGPKYRHFKEFDKWAIRFSQSLRWYSHTSWESITGLDFERPFSERFLFRTYVEGAWYEEKDGYFPLLAFSLFQALENDRALEYEWRNEFETRPTDRLSEIELRVKYRQTVWRKWLFFEIAPQVLFSRDRDFDSNPGIVLKLEAVFGSLR